VNPRLRFQTPKAWTDAVLADIDAFLIDHAAAERKAAATGMNFVVRYPDRHQLIAPMVAFAREELAHFQLVWAWLQKRGLQLGPDTKDDYVRQLMAWVRTGRDERLLDRLVMASVVEARGHERFNLLAEAMPDAALRNFYASIAASEQRHTDLFLELAAVYFDAHAIDNRLNSVLDFEASVCGSLPHRAALH
jgi:tRNA 2-(methylsulfanyl)-N6-isopentenyladenosine37 hydroxylase